METSRWNEIKVGLFVACGTGLLLLSIILLGGDRAFLNSSIKLRFHLKTVQGITGGSIVSLAGVNVGNVNKITFIPGKDLLEVEATIDRTFQSRITQGSLASIKTQGALGDKYIYIEPGPPEAKPYEDGALIPAGGEPDLFDKLAARGGELTNVVDVINEALILLKNLNANGKSAEVMSRIVALTESMDKTMGEFKQLARDARGGEKEELRKTIEGLRSIILKIEKGEGTLGALIQDRALYDRLKQLLGGSARDTMMKSLIRDSISKGTD